MPDKEKHEGLPQRDAVKDQQSERPETADVLAAAREPLPSSAPSLPSAASSVSAQTADAELVPEPNSALPAAAGDAAGAAATDAPPTVTGPEVIQRYLKLLPAAPGVYRMLDAEGNVIYVGKARSLKARVSNYTRLGGHTNRIARMIATTASMEFVSVRTEAEALLLEANLIKRFRPRFNVLMRDDKSFPYILIARDTPAPQILKHRGARNRKGDYFGPFASAGAVSRTINMLERAFLLRSCSDSVYESRTRPCLLHQIKRCAAPCTGEISLDEYGHLVDEAVRFLRGESQNVRRMYQSLMEEAAACLEYERAARYRDRLSALAHVTADQSINPEGIEEADVFAAAQEGGQTCIEVFFFRTGQNWGNRAYFPKADRALSVEEVLDSFIAQFYDDKPVPRLILLSHDVPSRDLLAEALCIKSERRTEIQVPQRGTKLGIVDHALANAREALGRKLAESSSQRRLLEGVAERFGLPETPRRIEVYDNSHIQGTNAVGAMIVAGPDGFVKGQYRKFNIKSQTITPGDDYGMMREVLTRRFKRLVASENKEARKADAGLAENVEAAELAGMIAADNASAAAMDSEMPETNASEDDVFPDRPDLVLIDGGAGQLSVAREVMSELGLNDIQLIGVAKGPDRDAGREHFHFPFRERSIMLEPRDPVLYFVQRLRDEAHRFAIGSHRTRRSMAITASPLDEIEGIGPRRRRALMSHFGSAKAVSRAGVEDLKAVEGISAEMARRIYDHFHERRS
ncbi:excinuclease ABC subunit UvrC [Hyphomicrobium sulfonivorans]|uniref:excinuclease ABC subunit UvrC n=1 Tax=Hyphomicrobium sulfonivorans TaxID=121290 RepID=UPI001570D233|nr:excinuclease ABC subunit UvrC [Hyphomicrobium sulfonivorans]MBI1649052.1 excinuclease ABC subunit UvrC [Hyphomicrobium sulfonivorans]NSL70414.1 excinuclease ABC subunit C [Hyphomicrobium sulfonivorans]